MQNAQYQAKYNAFKQHIEFVVQALSEEAGSTINSAAQSGQESVQALFDAVMDQGHRMVLVQALNSPSITGWVRERLESFLYGERKQSLPALFKRTLH